MAMDGRPSWFKDTPLEMLGVHLLGLDDRRTGAYMRLLYAAWLQEPPATLPDDDQWLWPRAGCADLSAWQGVKQDVLSGWRRRDGRIELPWLRQKYDEAMSQIRQNRTNGLKGGEATARRSAGDRSPPAEPHARSLSPSGSGSVSPPIRVLPNQTRAIWDEYPAWRRGPWRSFPPHVEPAWAILVAQGCPDPGAELLARVRAYAAVWLRRRDAGQDVEGCQGPARFFGEGTWEQDPSDLDSGNGTAGSVSVDEIARRARETA